MLPAYRPNFAEVAHPTKKGGQACSKWYMGGAQQETKFLFTAQSRRTKQINKFTIFNSRCSKKT
jgi:hypothetical protein